MNIPQLLNAFTSLSLNGADISVERHGNNEFSVSGVLHLASDDELEQSVSFVIDADRNSQTFALSLTFVTVDTELEQTFYDGQVNLTGADAWDHSCKLHDAIKALIAEPETTPPACDTVQIEISFIKIHDIMGCFHEAGCDLPTKWNKFFTDGISSFDADNLENNEADGIIYTMSIRDAKALRNRAHRAARAWINEHGDDWQNHILEDLRNTLDRELVTA